MLYVLATPIGNLGDLSDRAKEVLAHADVLACEDTRVTAKLLQHLKITRAMLSYREENEHTLASELADRIAAGQTVALLSDAGTPCMSDPGFRLVRECRRRNLPVTSLPGPMAAVAALSISGLPTNAFYFGGFLPPKAHGRALFLEKHRALEATLIVYESCYRVEKAMEQIVEILGPDRCICVARELTKLHETVLTGSAKSVCEQLKTHSLRGEFVILIAPEGYSL